MRNLIISFAVLALVGCSPEASNEDAPSITVRLPAATPAQTKVTSATVSSLRPDLLVPLIAADFDRVGGAGCSMTVGGKTIFAIEYGGSGVVRLKGGDADSSDVLNGEGIFDLDKPNMRSLMMPTGSGVPPLVFQFVPLATKWTDVEPEVSTKPASLTVTQLTKNGNADYNGKSAIIYTARGTMQCGA